VLRGVNQRRGAVCCCRYNLSHLEQWLRDNKLHDTDVHHALDPIIQASQLLQARKTDADVECICEMCSQLTPTQVNILAAWCNVRDFDISWATFSNEKENLWKISYLRTIFEISEKALSRHNFAVLTNSRLNNNVT